MSGDLAEKFKTMIINSERNPLTGDSKEMMLVECSASRPAQNLQGLFSGEMTQEFKAGARTPASLNAQGKEGFADLHLEVHVGRGYGEYANAGGEGAHHRKVSVPKLVSLLKAQAAPEMFGERLGFDFMLTAYSSPKLVPTALAACTQR